MRARRPGSPRPEHSPRTFDRKADAVKGLKFVHYEMKGFGPVGEEIWEVPSDQFMLRNVGNRVSLVPPGQSVSGKWTIILLKGRSLMSSE